MAIKCAQINMILFGNISWSQTALSHIQIKNYIELPHLSRRIAFLAMPLVGFEHGVNMFEDDLRSHNRIFNAPDFQFICIGLLKHRTEEAE